MLLDGSMGALIFSYKLSEGDYRGRRFSAHAGRTVDIAHNTLP